MKRNETKRFLMNRYETENYGNETKRNEMLACETKRNETKRINEFEVKKLGNLQGVVEKDDVEKDDEQPQTKTVVARGPFDQIRWLNA